MGKLWVLIRREYAQVVKKKSFVIGIVLMPLFLILVTVLPAMLVQKKSSSTEKIAIIDIDGQKIGERFAEKLADYKLDDGRPAYEVTDIYEVSPEDSPEEKRLRAELDSLIQNKQLKNYLIINKGILTNDSCFMVAKSFSFRTNSRFDYSISRVLSTMRLEQSNINIPTDSVLQLTHRVVFEQLSPGGKQRDFMTMYMGGIVFVLIIFGTVIGFGQILMRSIIEEKNSRIVEVIASSVSPFQMMAGKIIGLGLASLTQVAVWVGIALIIYSAKGSLNISGDIADIVFNPVFIFFFIVYLILGYILYSTIFALIGSIVNSDKEAQNFIFPITISVMLPILMAMYIVQEPDSLVTTVISLIPIFTPTMMVIRLNFIGVETFSIGNPMKLSLMTIMVGVKIGISEITVVTGESGSWTMYIAIRIGSITDMVIGNIKFCASLSLLTIDPISANMVEYRIYPRIR